MKEGGEGFKGRKIEAILRMLYRLWRIIKRRKERWIDV